MWEKAFHNVVIFFIYFLLVNIVEAPSFHQGVKWRKCSPWASKHLRYIFVQFIFSIKLHNKLIFVLLVYPLILLSVLVLMHVVPLFPVSGFFSSHVNKVRFSAFSIYSIVNSFLLLFGTVELILAVKYGIDLGLQFSSVSSMAFFGVTLASGFALRKLAIQWPTVIRIWDKLENTFLRHPYRPPRYNLTVILTVLSYSTFSFMFRKFESPISTIITITLQICLTRCG